jgi:serine/threonine protein kinase
MLKEISALSNSIAIGGPHQTILRLGLGVAIEPPLSERVFEIVFGSIVAIDTEYSNLTIRLLLSRDNLPDYVLSKLGPNELVQTNALWTVPFEWVSGTFSVLPPQLFNAERIHQKSETEMTKKFLSRIVVCDMQILPEDVARFSGSEDEITVSYEIFSKLVQGKLRVTLSRLKPFPPHAALAYLHRMNELAGGLSPPALAYKCNLGQALITFARQKAAHQRSAKDQLSFRPDVPGRALMELLYRTIKPDNTLITIRNGVLMVEVKDLDALTSVFGTSPSSFDLRGEGLGVVEFLGPFVFKWSMYDTVDPWGPLAGSVSISVGSFTEYNRMGTDVIKSSRCHPDALRASGIKAPAQKRARTSQTSSDTRRVKLASQAQAQADQRRQRQASRSAMSAGGSGAESMTPSDERDGQPPYNSDSQSGGEGPASAYSESPADRSSSQSDRGFPDGDLMELVDGIDEDWLNAPAARQGELRGDGPAAPA